MRSVSPWKKLRGESGTVLILTALSMTALMGFMGFAIDVGLMFKAKRNLQTVADAAATAGALDYYYNSSDSSAEAAATRAATANGVTTGSGGATVTPTSPAAFGVHTGAGTVSVDITQSNPTIFMRVLRINSATVEARAVAGDIAGQACNFINNSLIVKGSATIEGWNPNPPPGHMVTGCGVYAKNNVNVTGNGNTFDVNYVATSGTLTGNQNTNPAPVVQNAPVQTIPPKLQITPPTPSNFASCNPPGLPPYNINNKGILLATLSGSLSPGCYGLGASGATAMNIDLGGTTTTMAPGLYMFDLGTGGTLTLDNNVSGGSAGDKSAGVTLDINTGNFSVTSTTNDSLYAPGPGSGAASVTAGYAGVLLLEPASNTGTINFQWGSSSGTWSGYIDAPGASATMQDQGGSPLITGLVLGNLTINGTLKELSYDSVYSDGAFRTITLVE